MNEEKKEKESARINHVTDLARINAKMLFDNDDGHCGIKIHITGNAIEMMKLLLSVNKTVAEKLDITLSDLFTAINLFEKFSESLMQPIPDKEENDG